MAFLLLGSPMGQNLDIHGIAVAALGGKQQFKISIRPKIPGFEADGCGVLALAFDLGFVSWRIECTELLPLVRFQVNFEGKLFDGAGGKLTGIQGAYVTDQVAVAFEELGILEANFFFLSGLNREDANFEEALPGIFKQGWIPGFADNVFVDLPGFACVQKFRRCQLSVDLHFKTIDGGITGNGKEKGAFEALMGRVVKDLFELGDRLLAFDVGFGMEASHFQREELLDGSRRNRTVGRRMRNGNRMRMIDDDDSMPIEKCRQKEQG